MIPLDSAVDSGEGVVEVDIVIVMLEALKHHLQDPLKY